MNNYNESQPIVSEWLKLVHAHAQQSGQFTATDTTDRPVVLEWHITNIVSSELAAFKKNVADLAAQTHAASEVEFLRAHPEAVAHDPFLKSCAPFFESGVQAADWQQIESTIQSTYKQFYTMDITSFGADIIKRIADDLYFFVSIKEHSADNKPKDILGFMMTAITPALAYGDIKLITVAVDPKASNCGLDELLLSSVFKVIPDIQRIFTMIRPTNKHALHTYMSRGFTKDCNPVQDPNHPINTDYLVSLEYKTKQSDRLQKVAETLVD